MWFLKSRSELIGKMVELQVRSGAFVYGLCSHDLGTEGQVLHLYAPLFRTRLSDPVEKLQHTPIRTALKFPLEYVLKEPEVEIVGSVRLKGKFRKLPKFRSLGLHAPDEMPTGWWIIDGDQETWVDALTHEMAHYPDDGIYSLGAIENLYVKDLYPHSPALLKRGPLAFELPKAN